MSDQALLEAEQYAPFNAVQLDLPGYTARFWTGLGSLPFLGQSFVGAGELSDIGVIEGTLEPDAPRMNIGLTGLDPALYDEIKDYLVRLSPVSVWFSTLDLTTWRPHGAPDLVMTGRIGSPRVKAGETVSIVAPVLGAMEWAKRRTVRRRQPSYHENIFPGDKYYEFFGDNDLTFPFGDKEGVNPRRSASGSSGGGGGGGGGRFSRNPYSRF